MEPLILESCHSTWHFDTDRMMFRRLLTGGTEGHLQVATDWRPYHALEVTPDSESFTVVLNAQGTRLLRSWRHTEDCAQCGSRLGARRWHQAGPLPSAVGT
jgi:hypothetical protein